MIDRDIPCRGVNLVGNGPHLVTNNVEVRNMTFTRNLAQDTPHMPCWTVKVERQVTSPCISFKIHCGTCGSRLKFDASHIVNEQLEGSSGICVTLRMWVGGRRARAEKC